MSGVLILNKTNSFKMPSANWLRSLMPPFKRRDEEGGNKKPTHGPVLAPNPSRFSLGLKFGVRDATG